MATAKLVLDKRYKNKDLIDHASGKDENTYPLVIRVFCGDVYRDISLHLKFRITEWDGSRVSTSYPNSKRVTSTIQYRYASAVSILSEYHSTLESMDVSSVRDFVSKEIENRINPKVNEDLQSIVDSSMTKEEGQLWLGKFAEMVIERTRKKKENATANWYADGVAAIKAYNDGKDILLAKIDISFLEGFEAHHLSIGNKVNAISAYLRAVRSLSNKAIREVLKGKNYQGYPWGRFGYSIKNEKTKKRAIPVELINDIRKLDLNHGSALWNAQNYLLFIFNNRGMNLIDIAKLRKSQIINPEYKNGKLVSGRLEYIRSKTDAALSMKLTGESIAILNSYNFFEKADDDFVFPIGYVESKTGRATYNQNRKRINACFGELAVLSCHPDVDVTTYAIRHTWGTHAKRKGISLEMIKDGYGHTDPRTTVVYTDTYEQTVLDDMNDRVVGKIKARRKAVA